MRVQLRPLVSSHRHRTGNLIAQTSYQTRRSARNRGRTSNRQIGMSAVSLPISRNHTPQRAATRRSALAFPFRLIPSAEAKTPSSRRSRSQLSPAKRPICRGCKVNFAPSSLGLPYRFEYISANRHCCRIGSDIVSIGRLKGYARPRVIARQRVQSL